MRILTVVHNLDVGGAQGSAKNASLAYVERGQQVAVLALHGGGRREQSLRDAGVELFVGGPSAEDRRGAVQAAANWRPDVMHVHRSGHADAVHGEMIRAIRAASPNGVAVIETNIFARVDDSRDAALFDVHMMLTRYCLWKWRLWARGMSPQPLGAVAPNIVRSDGFYPAGDEARRAFRKEHGIPQEAVVFARVGQPLRPKWSHAAFEAFRSFATQRQDAWFLVVGLPPNYPAYLRKFPENVRRRIVEVDFLHGDEALRACYAASDVFLHSAHIGESFGLVLAEAMLCERPVITLSAPMRDNSQLEVVGHERGGLVAASVDGMVQAMGRLADDPVLRAKFGRQGRQWCLANYDSAVVGDIMLRIAELAYEHRSDRQRLAAALASDELLTTSVSDEEIQRLLMRSIGAPRPLERALARVVHAPLFYRFWRQIRHLQRRIRGPIDKEQLMQKHNGQPSTASASR